MAAKGAAAPCYEAKEDDSNSHFDSVADASTVKISNTRRITISPSRDSMDENPQVVAVFEQLKALALSVSPETISEGYARDYILDVMRLQLDRGELAVGMWVGWCDDSHDRESITAIANDLFILCRTPVYKNDIIRLWTDFRARGGVEEVIPPQNPQGSLSSMTHSSSEDGGTADTVPPSEGCDYLRSLV